MTSSADSARWLIRAWTHSHEEDVPGTKTFRPDDRQVPASRGRSSFELKPDGQLVFSGPGPDDRHQITTGTWRLNGQHLSFQLSGHGDQAFEIVTLEPDRLILRT